MAIQCPDALLELLAVVFLPGETHAEASDAAIRALEAGIDSPTLRMIAGLSGPTDSLELESLARTMLDELQLPMPEHFALVRSRARPVARRFLTGEMAPGEFAEALYDLSRKDEVDGHHPWCQLNDDWSLVGKGAGVAEAEVIAALTKEAESIDGRG